MLNGLVVLDSAAVRRLIKSVGCDIDLLVYLGEWITHLNLFSDAQIYGILIFVKSGICEFDRLASTGKVPVASFGIADSRWVSFVGQNKFLDVTTLDEVDEIPQRAVTHIICDVTALWARMHYRQGRFNDRDTQSDASTADQAGQLRSADSPSGIKSGPKSVAYL